MTVENVSVVVPFRSAESIIPGIGAWQAAQITGNAPLQLEQGKQQEKMYVSKAPARTESISLAYQSFMLVGLIDNIDEALREWQEGGDPLVGLSLIKEALNVHKDALKRKADSRILLSLIQMIFQNNNWLHMGPESIEVLRASLNEFKSGRISPDLVSKFSKTIYRSGVSILKEPDEGDKTE